MNESEPQEDDVLLAFLGVNRFKTETLLSNKLTPLRTQQNITMPRLYKTTIFQLNADLVSNTKKNVHRANKKISTGDYESKEHG